MINKTAELVGIWLENPKNTRHLAASSQQNALLLLYNNPKLTSDTIK